MGSQTGDMKLMRRIAVMDLGSQTFRMALAECRKNNIQVSGSWLENVRLGQGLSETGRLNDNAVKRGISALEKFTAILKESADEDGKGNLYIEAVGTAALRSAENAKNFILAAEKSGMNIKIISAEEEAAITADGVLYTLDDLKSRDAGASSCSGMEKSGYVATIDVGGGSTEISVCSAGHIREWTSIDIGAVRLTEAFSPKLKSQAEHVAMDAMIRRIDQALEESLPEIPGIRKCTCLAGSGGTITTAAAMELAMASYDPAKIRGLVLTTQSLDKWIMRLSGMTNSEKGSISGLEPERSDIILAGIVTVARIMTKTGFTTLVTSDGGLLLGLLIRAIEKECTSHAESSRPGGLYV